MATLSDVAEAAEVSKATASRALSRPDLVAPGTVRRVRAAAEHLGFVPNRAARSLARGRTGIVAAVVPTLDNSFFTPIIGGAQSRAAESDLQVTVAVHALEDPTELRAFERLASQVDGFVVVAPRAVDELVRAAGATKPTVLVDREVSGMTSVVADTATAFGLLVEELVAGGHQDIAYVGGPEGSWQDAQRTVAVRRAAADRGARLVVLGPCPSTFAAGASTVDAVLESRVTAVIPYATAIGMGLMLALHARGVSTPGDILVSTERAVVESLHQPGLPAIDVDGAQLGRVAMDRLVSALDDGVTGEPERLRLPVRVASANWHPTDP